MKKGITVVLLLFLLFGVAEALATGKNKVVVLPFSRSAPAGEDIEYIGQGVSFLLSDKIAEERQVAVLPREAVVAANVPGWEKGLSLEEAIVLGRKIAADYVVCGNIVKIGGSVSIDARVIDTAAPQHPLSVSLMCEKLDDVIPQVAAMGRRIAAHINGSLPASTSTANGTLLAPVGAEFTKGRAAINTDSGGGEIVSKKRMEDLGGKGKGGVWLSEAFPGEFVAVDVGDITGDKKNEIVAASKNRLRVFRKEGESLVMLHSMTLNEHILSLDVYDTDGDGIAEIVVSALASRNTATEVSSASNENVVASLVVEYKNGSLTKRATKLPWLLRVIDTTAGPRLVGQRLALNFPFDNPIYEIVYRDGKYQEGNDVGISRGLPVYSLALAQLDPNLPERVVSVNDDDYLCLYEKTAAHISTVEVFGGSANFVYKSNEYFGGSNSYIQYKGAPRYGDPVEVRRVYVNPRIVVTDALGGGKPRLILARNISPAGRVLQTMKVFTSSEMVSLEWDGLGVAEFWRTRSINGYIADFNFKDADNDGARDLVLAVVKSSGSGLSETSVIAIYKFAPVEP